MSIILRECLALLILGAISLVSLFLIPHCTTSDTAISSIFQLVNTIASGLVGYIGGRMVEQKRGNEVAEEKKE